MKKLPKGEGWMVLAQVVYQRGGIKTDGLYGVYPAPHVGDRQAYGFHGACKLCALDARAGNADAIAAVLMCSEDNMLREAVAALESYRDR